MLRINFCFCFQKVLTCFYKVFENGDFANAVNFVSFINGSDVGISDVVEITIGMDCTDWTLYNIYFLSYACIVGVIIGDGAVSYTEYKNCRIQNFH